MAERELTTGAVARMLGRSRKVVRGWCERGVIRCRITSGPNGQNRYWIPESEVTRMSEERRTGVPRSKGNFGSLRAT